MVEIGMWVRRVGAKRRRDGSWTVKWHKVVRMTSKGSLITACGLLVFRYYLDHWETSEVEPLTRMIGQPQLCKRCDRGSNG